MMSESDASKPLALMLSGAAGAAVGAAILLLQPGEQGQEFIRAPQFKVWLFFIIAVMAFAAVIAAPLFKSLRRLKGYWAGSRREIILSSLALALLCAMPSLFPAPFEEKLAYHRLRMGVLLGAGVVVALMAVGGIWLVRAALRDLASSAEPTQEHIQTFLRLREQLQFFLSVLGILVGGLTLATGALRNALVAAPINVEGFPPELVLVYGAYFTALVALIYAPTYLALIAAGRKLRDDLLPMPSPKSDAWDDWYDRRKDLEELLQLQQGAAKNFQAGFAILAPLAGSIITVLIGKS
jgi:hypothetical protein